MSVALARSCPTLQQPCEAGFLGSGFFEQHPEDSVDCSAASPQQLHFVATADCGDLWEAQPKPDEHAQANWLQLVATSKATTAIQWHPSPKAVLARNRFINPIIPDNLRQRADYLVLGQKNQRPGQDLPGPP